MPDERMRRRLFQVVSTAVVLVVLSIVLAPDSDAATSPVVGVHRLLRHAGAPHWATNVQLWGGFFNVLLFVPVGVIGALVRPRFPLWGWLLVGLVLSGSIELTQGLLLPQRDADPVDVATNTVGVLLGAWAVRRARLRPSRPGTWS